MSSQSEMMFRFFIRDFVSFKQDIRSDPIMFYIEVMDR